MSKPDEATTGDSSLLDVVAVVRDSDMPSASEPKPNWEQLAGVVSIPVAGPALAVSGLVVLAVRGYRQSRSKPHVALLPQSEANRLAQAGVRFPHGGPTAGTVYARHPLRSEYFCYADYHRSILHEKSIEAARYLLALGASDVEISLEEATGQTTSAAADVPAPGVAEIKVSMGLGRDAKGRLSIRIEGAGRRDESAVADLAWPHHDPMFRLVRDAAAAGAAKFHFGIAAESSGTVNAEAAVKLVGDLGVSLGGEYKRWEDLAFTVDAAFSFSSPTKRES